MSRPQQTLLLIVDVGLYLMNGLMISLSKMQADRHRTAAYFIIANGPILGTVAFRCGIVRSFSGVVFRAIGAQA